MFEVHEYFWLVFLMHVLKRTNKESFDLVEFVASVSQVDFVARSPSNGRFFEEIVA